MKHTKTNNNSRYTDNNTKYIDNTGYTNNNTQRSSKKDKELKIRLNSEDKKLLQTLAEEQKLPLSSFVLNKCLNDKLRFVPDTVEVWNTCNEILRCIKENGNEQLAEMVKTIICEHLPTDTREDL
jgi:hypothetical protein